MHKIWQKGCAMVLASFMVLSALVVFAATARADYEITSDIALNYDNNWQEPAVEPADTVLLTYNWDDVNNHPFRLGDTTDWIQFGIVNTDPDAGDNMHMTEVTLSCSDGAIENIVGDDGGVDDVDEIDAGDVDPIPAIGGVRNARFTFDIAPDAELGLHEITIDIDFEKPVGTPDSESVDAYIYISSIFDNTATEDDHEGLADLWETAVSLEDAFFEAGDSFVEANLVLTNYATDITDLVGVLNVPTGGDITCYQDNDMASNTGITAGTTAANALRWRLDIASNTPADIYDGSVDITYFRNGQEIDEGTLDVGFPVDFNFADTDCGPIVGGTHQKYSEEQIRATEVVITDDGTTPTNETNTTRQANIFPLPYDEYEQSTFSDRLITVDVTVENNGNVDLANVDFTFAPTGWDYFRNPLFFWEDINAVPGTPSYDSAIYHVDSFIVGDTETFTIQVIVEKEIPIGEHRLPLIYNGYYYNGGQLGGASGYDQTAADLETYFSIVVTDGQMDCRIYETHWGNQYEGDITYRTVDVDVINLEGYSFIDVIATADFTGTPFYAPIVTERETRSQIILAEEQPESSWAAYDDESGTPTTDDELDLHFMVDVDTEPVPDLYPFTVTLTAIIEETLVPVETTISGVVEITGFGPRVYISAFTTSDIEAGNFFDLTLNITNDGDDDLRDAWIYIDPDGTYPDPDDFNDIVCDFIGQIQRENYTDGSESYSWDGTEVTLEDLDIDSAKEMVALNLYIEGVYSSPGAVITLFYIDTIAAGETIQVDYQMMADKDMVDGKPYTITANVIGVDSDGVKYDENYTMIVKTSKDSVGSYEPAEMDLFMGGMQVMGLILFIIIVVAVLFYVLRKVVFPPKKEEPKQ